MKAKKKNLLIVLAIFSLLLVACGSEGSETNTPESIEYLSNDKLDDSLESRPGADVEIFEIDIDDLTPVESDDDERPIFEFRE